jgi:hypothetical protein
MVAAIALGVLPSACVGQRDLLVDAPAGDDGGSQMTANDGGPGSGRDADRNDAAVADSSVGQGDDATSTVDASEAGDDDAGEDDSGYPVQADSSSYYSDVAAIPDVNIPEVPPPVVTCPAPTPNNDSLPFVVDEQGIFVPSGFEGDAVNQGVLSLPYTPGDPSCPGGIRSSATAVGNCHMVTYSPVPGGSGWAGVIWQHPANNWGTQPGYAIPAGATQVALAARGAHGGEVVTFLVGGTNYGSQTAAAPCADPVQIAGKVTLTNAWVVYVIPLGGASYASGVLGAFGFNVTASSEPGGRPVTFYIDDLKWQ